MRAHAVLNFALQASSPTPVPLSMADVGLPCR